MDIAVFSGSFNPLHIGHLAIIRTLAESGRRVYLTVSPQNPLKAEADVTNAENRLKAAREAVSRHPELKGLVRVDDTEFRLPRPNYSINTLNALKLREPGNSFSLVIGADQFADIRRWREYGTILREFGVIVFPRDGIDIKKVRESLLEESSDYKIELVEMPEVPVSSTQIRNAESAAAVEGLLM